MPCGLFAHPRRTIVNRFRPGLALATLVMAAAVASAAHAQPAPAPEAFLRLEDLERLALQNNPTAAQADAVVQSVLGRRVQAGYYPNPIVGYQADDINTREPGRARHFFFVQQSIITAGKRRLVLDAVAQEQAHAGVEAEMQKQRIVNSVRVLFHETLGAERLLQLRRDLVRIAADAVQTSEQLYNVGQADRPDVIEVQIEAQRAQVEAQRAEHEVDRAWEALAAMVGQPDLSRATLVGDLEAALPEVDEASIRTRIIEGSPELKIAHARVEHAKASLARARAERIPNFFVRAGAGYNSEHYAPGKDVGAEFRVELGVPLPIFDRNLGNITTAEGQLKVAEGELRRIELSLRTRVASAMRNYRDALRGVEGYRQGVLAQSQQAYEMYLRRFRQMAASYPQVLIAQRALAQVRVDYVRTLVDLWQNATLLNGLLLMDGLTSPEAVPGEPQVRQEALPFTVTP
jgi:cobalt-zinc-cadmium efflux system outer membrane protein